MLLCSFFLPLNKQTNFCTKKTFFSESILELEKGSRKNVAEIVVEIFLLLVLNGAGFRFGFEIVWKTNKQIVHLEYKTTVQYLLLFGKFPITVHYIFMETRQSINLSSPVIPNQDAAS